MGYAGITIPEGNVVKITANGVVLWEKVIGRLPKEYQEVEWIKAPDTVGAYINLGFAFDTKAKLYISQFIKTVEVNTQYGYLFGASENSGAKRCMITSPYVSNGGATLYGSTGTSYLSNTVSIKQNAINEFECVLQKGKLYFSNITTGQNFTHTTQSEVTMTSNLYLFAQNYNDSPRFGYNRTIKAFQYYDKTDTLICDLVPCYRKSDGVIGMYDIVRKTFLTNAGTGSFTKGADV